MQNTFLNKHKFLLILLHILIGVLAISRSFVLVFSSLLLLVGVINIINNKDNKNQALHWCMYAVGFEILFRITKGAIFYEYVKYICIIYLIIGFVFTKTSKKIPLNYFLYLLLLFVSIIFFKQESFAAFRQEVAFNLSGPFLLGIISIYVYKKVMSLNQVFDLLKLVVLPILSTLTYLFFYTSSISEIIFTSAANFESTAGFGPNQVATLFGFGIFIFIALILYKKRLSNLLIIDLLILFYLIYRTLLTFSRGGMLTGVIASFIILFFYLLLQPNFIKSFSKIFIITFLLGGIIFTYTSDLTDNVLTYRYTGKTTYGDDKNNLTSNRTGYLKDEFEIFLKNPIFGVGPGGSKYLRKKLNKHIGSSHSETSRLLSEHGLIGLFSLVFLFSYPLFRIFKRKNNSEYAFSLAFFTIWFLTINHSAMRLALPSIVYGLSLIIIKK